MNKNIIKLMIIIISLMTINIKESKADDHQYSSELEINSLYDEINKNKINILSDLLNNKKIKKHLNSYQINTLINEKLINSIEESYYDLYKNIEEINNEKKFENKFEYNNKIKEYEQLNKLYVKMLILNHIDEKYNKKLYKYYLSKDELKISNDPLIKQKVKEFENKNSSKDSRLKKLNDLEPIITNLKETNEMISFEILQRNNEPIDIDNIQIDLINQTGLIEIKDTLNENIKYVTITNIQKKENKENTSIIIKNKQKELIIDKWNFNNSITELHPNANYYNPKITEIKQEDS